MVERHLAKVDTAVQFRSLAPFVKSSIESSFFHVLGTIMVFVLNQRVLSISYKSWADAHKFRFIYFLKCKTLVSVPSDY